MGEFFSNLLEHVYFKHARILKKRAIEPVN